MKEIPILIDTNILGDIEMVLRRLKDRTGKGYKELWSTFSDHLIGNETKELSRVIKTMHMIVEMIKSSEKFVLHIPSHVYNEAVVGLTSKINKHHSQASEEAKEGLKESYKELFESLPFEKEIDYKTKLVEESHYPKKFTKDIEKTMLDFLKTKIMDTSKKEEDQKFKELLEHLKNPDSTKKNKVQETTNKLKMWMNDINYKNKNWDGPMLQASKIHGFPYETKTKSLVPLYGSISQYPTVKKIPFERDPLNVVAERLTMKDEEFDFFDLQIYLYAKEKGAAIMTLNTQAFQEIYDPSFLGYFEDVKIIHPLINFDTIEDLKKPTVGLDKMIQESIERDFKKVDIPICNKLDQQLSKPVIEGFVEKKIENVLNQMKSKDKKPLEIDLSLGALLKLLRIENKQLKVSRQFFFENYSTTRLFLRDVDKELFRGQLRSRDFVDDDRLLIEQLKKDVFKKKQKEVASFLKNNEGATTNSIGPEHTQKLDNFLQKYKEKTLTGQDANSLFNSLQIESYLLEPKRDRDSGSRRAVLPANCPPSTSRRKREIKCFLKWEDIDRFNEEKLQKRNPSKVQIDSKRFLELFKTTNDRQKRLQLLQFVDQVHTSAGDHTTKIIGPNEAQVIHLVNNYKLREHLGKVYRVSSAINYGIFAKHLVSDILEGNIKGVTMNVGFISAQFGLSKLERMSLVKGVRYAGAGKVVLGNSLKYASPFIGRLTSAVIVWDLYQQVQALKAGDKDAIVLIAGDSILLAIDLAEITVSLLEISGMIAGVSSTLGPIGLATGAVVFIGTEVFLAIRTMQKVDEIINLTTMERLEMLTPFLSNSDLIHLAEIKQSNNKLAKLALAELKKSEGIQRIVIPSAEIIGNEEVRVALDNTFLPSDVDPNIGWDRVRPEDPEGGKIFCAPQGSWEPHPSGAIAKCFNAIGVADLTQKKNNYTLFELGDGDDEVIGFKDSPNIFRIGKGKKNITGGFRDDIFIIEKNMTYSDFPTGTAVGRGCNNILDVSGVRTENHEAVIFQSPVLSVVDSIELGNLSSISFPKLKMLNFKLHYPGIHSIIGREGATDYVVTSCETRNVDTKGGRSSESPDQIDIIQDTRGCNYNMNIKLSGDTLLTSEIESGEFFYLLDAIQFRIRCRLMPGNARLINEKNRVKHMYMINSTLSDVTTLEFHDLNKNLVDQCKSIYTIKINFKNNHNYLYLDPVCVYGGRRDLLFYLKDNTELRLHDSGMYGILKSDISVPGIIRKYRPIANNLGIPVFVHAIEEDASVWIGSGNKANVLHNDPSHRSYLVGNGGSNVYAILSGRDVIDGAQRTIIPNIDIYITDGTNHTSVLDLRPLSQQFEKGKGKELLIKHIFDPDKLVVYVYTWESKTTRARSYNNVTSITFRNIPTAPKWNSWCTRLHVILNNAPVLLKCSGDYQRKFGKVIDYNQDVINYSPSNYYTPLPLVFSGYELIVIKREDVEPHTEVIVEKKLGKYRYSRLENDLILTNAFDIDNLSYHPITVLLQDFYEDPAVFNTLKFEFDDKILSLILQKGEIEIAMTLDDSYEEYNAISTNIMSSNVPRRSKRDLGVGNRLSKLEQSQASPTTIFENVIHSLSNIYYRSWDYVQDFISTRVSPSPLSLRDGFFHSKINENTIKNGGKLGWKADEPVLDEDKINYTAVNSTLLLLDTLLRKLNYTKYKPPTEEYLLAPQDQVEKKIAQLTTSLGLDLEDVAGSIEKHHQRMLEKMTEN